MTFGIVCIVGREDALGGNEDVVTSWVVTGFSLGNSLGDGSTAVAT